LIQLENLTLGYYSSYERHYLPDLFFCNDSANSTTAQITFKSWQNKAKNVRLYNG